LSSSRFAYLNSIQRILFHSIVLVATPEHLEHLLRADISRIAPWVTTVTFVAPHNNWALRFRNFKKALIAQAVYEYARKNHVRHDFDSDDGYRNFIEQHWSGRLPFFDGQVRVAYAKYHEAALNAKALLFSNGLKAAWTIALRALRNVERLHFTSEQLEELGILHSPVQPACIIRDHDHDRNHTEETCRRVAAPVGDALFAAGIYCLAKAKVKARVLDVACAMTGKLEWETLAGWKDLDLSQIWRFDFQPKVQSFEEDLDIFGGEDAIAARAANAVAAVLKKCGNKLEEFSYDRSCPIIWPGDKVIHLPRLRHLSLDKGSIRPHNLRAWIATMPSLEDLILFDSKLCEDVYHGWKYIFDAVRNHPTRMRVYFDRIKTNDAADLSLEYHTDDFQRVLKQEENQDPWEDIKRSLSLYLSGKIEFNRSLRIWLQDD